MQTEIFVREVRHDQKTGHITVRLQATTTHETATWDGMVADYGVSADLFYGLFKEDIDELCKYLVAQHRAKIGRHDVLTDKLNELIGKKIG